MGYSNTALEETAVWRCECTLLQGSMATLLSYNPDRMLEEEMKDWTAGRICKRLLQSCILQCNALVLTQVIQGKIHDTYFLSNVAVRSQDSSVTTQTRLGAGQIRKHGSTPSTGKKLFSL
jgi:hypothetical protein